MEYKAFDRWKYDLFYSVFLMIKQSMAQSRQSVYMYCYNNLIYGQVNRPLSIKWIVGKCILDKVIKLRHYMYT